MNLLELFFTALALSMDAFAIAMCMGMSMAKKTVGKAFVIGIYFGGFQAGMPLIGYFAAARLPERIFDCAQWIAFAMLVFLGVKMIFGSLKGGNTPEGGNTAGKASVAAASMLPLALATSIDALAVGASFALLDTRIVPAASLIGATTFLISPIGVKIGSVFGTVLKSKAEFTGGAILTLIGIKILLEHLGIVRF